MTEINNIIQVNTIVNEAKQAAREAAEKFFQEKLGGEINIPVVLPGLTSTASKATPVWQGFQGRRYP
jgi:hypothetical protein